MYDVNPLGPTMHLKQIEREAKSLRTATAKGRSGNPTPTPSRIMRALKRLFIPLRGEGSTGNPVKIGRQ